MLINTGLGFEVSHPSGVYTCTAMSRPLSREGKETCLQTVPVKEMGLMRRPTHISIPPIVRNRVAQSLSRSH